MKQFSQEAIDTIKQLDPDCEMTEAVRNDDVAISFKAELHFQEFEALQIRGIQFLISQDKRQQFVTTLSNVLGDRFVVYCSEQNFGRQPDQITVLESADRYDAIRFEGCNGINYDIYTEDIVAYLQELEKTNPFVLTGAGFDFVQGNFIAPPSDMEELADNLYEFCPDIVDQGTQSIEGLIEELRRTNTFFLWWD